MTKPIIDNQYDNRMHHPLTREYYDQSDFFNFGYWLPETDTQKEASENLMEKLLAFVPEKKGAILDVACGMGATTRYLLKYYSSSAVTAINISGKQLEASKINAPGCAFLLMDATKLGFETNIFNNIICVEAAFHFDTREDFLGEACRLLIPDGHLVLSDILFSKWAVRWNPRLPSRNYVRDLKDYRDVYLRVGFQEIIITDATRESWTAFYKHLSRWRRLKFKAGTINTLPYLRMILRTFVANIGLKRYVLVSARKA